MDRQTAMKLCTEKLAQILYDCVECKNNPRNETDWLTAEAFFNKHPNIVDHVANKFDCEPTLEAFERAVQKNHWITGGRFIWEVAYQRIKQTDALDENYGRIL